MLINLHFRKPRNDREAWVFFVAEVLWAGSLLPREEEILGGLLFPPDPFDFLPEAGRMVADMTRGTGGRLPKDLSTHEIRKFIAAEKAEKRKHLHVVK